MSGGEFWTGGDNGTTREQFAFYIWPPYTSFWSEGTWTKKGELTPPQQVAAIADTVNNMGLSEDTVTSLGAKLTAAQAALASGDTVTACDTLKAFINATAAQSGKKKLTQEQANALIDAATQTRIALGCP